MLELSEPAAAEISASSSSPLLLDNPTMDGNCPQEWPEPIVAIQSLSESGATVIPEKYRKPPSQRPSIDPLQKGSDIPTIDIIDIEGFLSGSTKQAISDACKEWGFFQVVNHGVSLDLVERMREVWKEFFRLPMEEKKKLANDPITYQGYGSVLGVEKDVVLDWGDYFYLEVPSQSIRKYDKWPTLPDSIREITEEYIREIVNLCERLLKALSTSLGLDEGFLQKVFGGEDALPSIRVNYYPKCPQPELTLGLSPHSDPGGLTVLLADDRVDGLQVRKGNAWVPVRPAPGAFIVNIADQIQMISNGVYKSVEHRVTANSIASRLSIAFFYNPNNDVPIEPARELVTPSYPALYPPTTYREYRQTIRKKGVRGKSQVESLKAV